MLALQAGDGAGAVLPHAALDIQPPDSLTGSISPASRAVAPDVDGDIVEKRYLGFQRAIHPDASPPLSQRRARLRTARPSRSQRRLLAEALKPTRRCRAAYLPSASIAAVEMPSLRRMKTVRRS